MNKELPPSQRVSHRAQESACRHWAPIVPASDAPEPAASPASAEVAEPAGCLPESAASRVPDSPEKRGK